MNKKIKKIKNKPLSGHDIERFLNGETSVFLYSDLKMFNDIDEVFDDNDSFILLYRQSDNFGHWVCVIRNKNRLEFFDPYGFFIDKQKNWVSKKTNKDLGQELPYIQKLFRKSKYDLHYNDYKFQEMNNNIQTCGRHCISRILFKELNIDQYAKLFESLYDKYGDPDDIVSVLTYDV